jgi:hypothetical protein
VVAGSLSTIVGGFVPPWQRAVPHVPGPVLSSRGKTFVFQLSAHVPVPPLDEAVPDDDAPDEEAVPEDDPDEEAVPDDDPLEEPDELPDEEPLDDPLDDPLPGWGGWTLTRPLGGPNVVLGSPPQAAATAPTETSAPMAST